MIARLRREFALHPVRSMAAIGLIHALVFLNLKLFVAGGPWWRGWADQIHYLESARAFLRFDLSPEPHWYPLLYPLGAAPFAWMPAPFVPLNIACFALSFAGFRRVCARLDVGAGAAILLFLATTLLDWRIAKLWLEPWSTTLSTALVWLALAEAADWIAGEGRRPALLGALLGLAVLARPSDLSIALVVAPFAMWRPVIREGQWRVPLMATAGGVAVLAGYALLHLAVYGARWSDYALLSREMGFNFADLPWRMSVLLVAPSMWFPGEIGLLRAMPWLILGVAGAILAPFALSGQKRALAACLGLAGLAYCLTMLAYVDLLPSGMFRYNNVHYFKWLFPLLGLTTLLLVRLGREHRRAAAGVLAGLLLLTCFRYEAVPVTAGLPARALVYGTREVNLDSIYLARSTLDGQRNMFDYHQMPRSDHELIAVALKRDFTEVGVWNPAGDAG
ncbi:MAG: hypothetical protein ACAH11_06315, partial [Sphingomonas sp.]